MTGDDSVPLAGGFSHEAGIIPRVLYQLFNAIEVEGIDFAIKCSFIELYNEELRDLLYGEPITDDELVEDEERIPGSPSLKKGKKWKRYSGLFVLLKQKWTLSDQQKTLVLQAALATFRSLVYPNVRSFV